MAVKMEVDTPRGVFTYMGDEILKPGDEVLVPLTTFGLGTYGPAPDALVEGVVKRRQDEDPTGYWYDGPCKHVVGVR